MIDIIKLAIFLIKKIIVLILVYPFLLIEHIYKKAFKKDITTGKIGLLIIAAIGLFLLSYTIFEGTAIYIVMYIFCMYLIILFIAQLLWRGYQRLNKEYVKWDTHWKKQIQAGRQPEQEEQRIQRKNTIEQQTTED